ncbi:hypothetical protein OQA88_11343 [Cercophora sp. LCS_1]
MSHQRYPSSHDATVKEPHSVSLKVLRLSRPSLVTQHPLQPPLLPPTSHNPPIPASLAYSPPQGEAQTNPSPFILSPITNLPPSFGSAYVGETFSCTLCASHDGDSPPTKTIRDVRIKAEMKTPSSATTISLNLDDSSSPKGVDLDPGATLQRIVNFDLKEEGNHVLAVTVSYYEATDVSGRTRTFRKLYQFICKAGVIVRTKPGLLGEKDGKRRWVLEAQLENCGEDVMQLERVVLEVEGGLRWRDCNWEVEGGGGQRPVLHPGEAEQVCFVVEETGDGQVVEEEGRVIFGVLGVGWRGEMGNRGFLSTGRLGTRAAGKKK